MCGRVVQFSSLSCQSHQHVHEVVYKLSQALESEIVSHEPLIERVANTSQQMIAKRHYAASDVQGRQDNLQAQLQHLKDLASERRQRLNDAHQSHMVSRR